VLIQHENIFEKKCAALVQHGCVFNTNSAVLVQQRCVFQSTCFLTIKIPCMLTKKQLHPDAEPTPAAGQPAAKTKSTSAIPAADVDFMDVSKAVAATWMATPAITLVWINSTAFDKQVQDYATSLSSRKATGSLRPGQSFTLKQLDKQVDDATREVKVYIERKFKTAGAVAQFARYGIIKDGTNYRISRDRNNRKEALKLMVDAIAADGFAAEEYGTAFWTGMQTNYSNALVASGTTAGDVSGKVATKNQQKIAIKKVMTGLQLVLRANYPDTFKQVYRDWGWQKESY
jgi:hypothetical protein